MGRLRVLQLAAEQLPCRANGSGEPGSKTVMLSLNANPTVERALPTRRPSLAAVSRVLQRTMVGPPRACARVAQARDRAAASPKISKRSKCNAEVKLHDSRRKT